MMKVKNPIIIKNSMADCACFDMEEYDIKYERGFPNINFVLNAILFVIW